MTFFSYLMEVDDDDHHHIILREIDARFPMTIERACAHVAKSAGNEFLLIIPNSHPTKKEREREITTACRSKDEMKK